jgi:hypothetical protein
MEAAVDIVIVDVVAATPLAVAAVRPRRTEARLRRLPPPETSRRSISVVDNAVREENQRLRMFDLKPN